ncbi:MAG: TetR/AcrR family transcriptional regulator [Pseudomonadales bacterium]|jgi:TetR/AcrR family transcriptional regulator
MPDKKIKTNRRQQILESLVHMLEVNPGCRITTAALAKEVGVSEAALYRHFPSKFKMFEALIDYAEETIFSRVSTILKDHSGAEDRINHILTLMLTFTGRNPGITRILTGDALVGENDRLHARVIQLFGRLETQLKQILRDAELTEGLRPSTTNSVAANMLMAFLEGRISQFVRSNFKKLPMENWSEQWPVIMAGFFHSV